MVKENCGKQEYQFFEIEKIPVTALENHEYYLTNEPTQDIEEWDIVKIKKGIDLLPKGIHNINGFTGHFGIKVGVFNMGRKK